MQLCYSSNLWSINNAAPYPSLNYVPGAWVLLHGEHKGGGASGRRKRRNNEEQAILPHGSHTHTPTVFRNHVCFLLRINPKAVIWILRFRFSELNQNKGNLKSSLFTFKVSSGKKTNKHANRKHKNKARFSKYPWTLKQNLPALECLSPH